MNTTTQAQYNPLSDIKTKWLAFFNSDDYSDVHLSDIDSFTEHFHSLLKPSQSRELVAAANEFIVSDTLTNNIVCALALTHLSLKESDCTEQKKLIENIYTALKEQYSYPENVSSIESLSIAYHKSLPEHVKYDRKDYIILRCLEKTNNQQNLHQALTTNDCVDLFMRYVYSINKGLSQNSTDPNNQNASADGRQFITKSQYEDIVNAGIIPVFDDPALDNKEKAHISSRTSAMSF